LTSGAVKTERAALWRRARALDGADDAARSPRARALARRLTPPRAPMDYAAILKAPAWSALPLNERRRLAATCGAVLLAERLATSIDGRMLGVVGRSIGEGALDAVLAMPPAQRPETPPVGALDAEALEGLGAAALLAGLSGETARRLADGLAPPLLRLDAHQAEAARRLALPLCGVAA